MKAILSTIIRILSSLKITIAVLSLVIAGSIPATIIIQNQSSSFYNTHYGARAADIILWTGYDHFFTSAPFLALITIFFINMFTCTIKRFTRQLGKKKGGRFGPDILHIGLLILIAGALVSLSTRQEGTIFMGSGDSMLLPSGRYMNVNEFRYERYPDGRPMDWITFVDISESLDSAGIELQIQVNHPLRIDKLVIYQAGYRPNKAGGYETGLLITQDKGKPVILISFIFISAGLFLTIFQKRKNL